MPRINPQSLLKCLQQLLNNEGGIKGSTEVKRMVALMKKFSNTLVSKVCYTLILKETSDELITEFMAEGGWALVFQWLNDAIETSNNPFIREVLALLIKCPISLDRLKESNAPRTIKGLSKENDDPNVREMARSLVEMWLDFIKSGRAAVEPTEVPESTVIDEAPVESSGEEEIVVPLQPFKIVVRDGKRILLTVPQNSTPPVKVKRVDRSNLNESALRASERFEKLLKSRDEIYSESKSIKLNKTDVKSKIGEIKRREELRDKILSEKFSSLKSSKSAGHSKSLSDKSKRESERRLEKGNEVKDRFKILQKARKEKESPKRSDKDREKRKEKNKLPEDLEEMPQRKTPAISSLGKIPKKTSASSTISAAEASATGGVLGGSGSPSSSTATTTAKEPVPLPTAKKGSFSDERKRTAELNPRDRPKTVKTAPTKFRSTGLEEEAKPPPSRSDVKKKQHREESSSKRSSSSKDHKDAPPEKKSRSSDSKSVSKDSKEKSAEKKVVPSKPKPVLLESDMFSDALIASAMTEPRKKKRRPSSSSSSRDSKEGKESRKEGKSSPTVTSPREIKPLKFYRDTLEDSEKKETKDEEKVAQEAPRVKLYPEGIVVVHRSVNAPKKSVKWRPDAELVATQFFEMDETERVNVSRQNFLDLKAMERNREREALQMHKKGIDEEVSCIEKMPWGTLYIVDVPADKQPPEEGLNSLEKSVQAARQRTVLESIFFSRSMIPDSPAEPDPEYHPISDPKIIPLEDLAAGADATYDHSATGWPEPKPDLDKILDPSIPPPMGGFNAGYSTFPSFNVPTSTENWMSRTDEKTPVQMAYPGAPVPMYAMPHFGPGNSAGPTTAPPTAMGPDGYPMSIYPNGFPQVPSGAPIYGAPPMAAWGGWTGPRPPIALDTRNLCRMFMSSGNCKFGPKCRFLHPGVNCPPLPT